MASKQQLHKTVLIVVLVLLFKITDVFSNNSTNTDSVINSINPNQSYEGYGNTATSTTDPISSKIIIDLYESTVENSSNTNSVHSEPVNTTPISPQSSTATTTPAPTSTSIASTTTTSAVKNEPSVEVYTTTAAPPATTTAAPETTSNPQQMLIPPALVNASIAQMPNTKASSHKQGQIIIR